MNKLVTTLAATTLLFAGTTLYFWHELQALQPDADGKPPVSAAGSSGVGALQAADASAAASVQASARRAAEQTSSASNAAAGAAPAAAGSTAAAGGADSARALMLPFAKDFLRQYDDATQRASLIKAQRAGLESQYLRLKQRLGLSAAEYGQLLDLIAEEQMDQQANYFRCLVNPACDTSKVPEPRDRSSDYLALLGADGYAQLTAYRTALPEWQSVVQLRGRLSESNSLKDGDAERLLGALSAERERYVTESNQAGAKLRGWGNGTGMIWYSGDGGVEEQLASAAQYSERMRQSAASILNAEQLRAFVQIQEEMLASLATYLQSQQSKQG
jgi:hypothetical protein